MLCSQGCIGSLLFVIFFLLEKCLFYTSKVDCMYYSVAFHLCFIHFLNFLSTYHTYLLSKNCNSIS